MGSQGEASCDRRGRILDAAAQLFKHYGYQKTTIADIAREATIGVGTVYLEFPSKDAIVEALSAHRYQDVLAAMRAAAQGPHVPAALSAVFEARTDAFLRLAGDGTHGPDLMWCPCPGTVAAHQRFAKAEHALLCELLERGITQGSVAIPDPRGTAGALLAAYALTAPPLMFKRPPEEVRALLSDLHRLVLFGVVARAG